MCLDQIFVVSIVFFAVCSLAANKFILIAKKNYIYQSWAGFDALWEGLFGPKLPYCCAMRKVWVPDIIK